MTMIISGSTGLEFPDGSDQTTAFTSNSPTFTGTVAVEALTASGNVNFDSNTLFVDSVNNEVGIGTASPAVKLHVSGGNTIIDNATSAYLRVAETSTGNSNRGVVLADSTGMNLIADYGTTAIPMVFKTSNTERMRLDSSGNLGLGVTPSAWGSPLGTGVLEGKNGAFFASLSTSSDLYVGTNAYFNGANWIYKTTNYATYYRQASGQHIWSYAASGTAGNAITFTQAMTLDASGKLLVGTTSAIGTAQVQSASSSVDPFEGYRFANNANGPALSLYKNRGATVGANAIVASGDELGTIAFRGYDGAAYRAGAFITGAVDGTPGSSDMPGRLVFSTTADGASSPTERFRIGSAGQLGIGGANYGTAGQVLTSGGSGAAPSWGSVSLPTGTIKQVVSATQGSVTSTSSSSYVDISGMSVTITPSSASNKIWIIVSMGGAASGGITDVPVLRNGSTIGNVPFTFYDNGDGNTIHGASYNYLDSPATTSAVTYKLQWRNQGGTTTYLNANRSGGGNTRTSSITVMEVVG